MNKKILFFTIIFISILLIITFFVFFRENDKTVEIEKLCSDIQNLSTYNNPIIPQDFKPIETDNASWNLKDGIPEGWNNGLVIEDKNENQFVWVPINIDLDTLKKSKIEDKYIITTSGKILTQDEFIQILKYQGFYVSRYEAGIPYEILKNTNEFSSKTNNIEGIPVSKKNQIVWNFIDFDKAKKNCANMYNNETLNSDLITSTQWDYILNWIISNYDIDIKDSKNYGNYSNSLFEFSGYYSIDFGKTYKFDKNKNKQEKNIILSTGAYEQSKLNNIYDLAGNVAEFVDTYNYNKKDKKIEVIHNTRGGYYDNASINSISSSMSISSANSKQGFRIVLYQK